LLAAVLPHADANLQPGAPWYITGPSGVAGIGFLAAIAACDWDLHQTLVWVKNGFVLGHADYHHQHELIYYGSKGGAARRWLGGRDKSTVIDDRPDYSHLKRDELMVLLRQRDNDLRTDVISIDRTRHNDLHPTMKPPALIRTMLANSTLRGDVVVDPFAGSGSTMVACEQLGRRAFLIELEAKFCDVIVRRWRELAPGNTVARIRDGIREDL
jgi:DNA modification methylase